MEGTLRVQKSLHRISVPQVLLLEKCIDHDFSSASEPLSINNVTGLRKVETKPAVLQNFPPVQLWTISEGGEIIRRPYH